MKNKRSLPPQDETQDAQRDMIVRMILAEVMFEGWTEAAYRRAIKKACLTRGQADLLFPQGIRDVVERFGAMTDAAVQKRIANEFGFARMRTRDKITFAVRARLEFWMPHREAVRRMGFWYALPTHLTLGIKRLYSTVDIIWRTAGDAATDFNFYTKRGLLAAVLKATIIFWLDDETPNCAASWEFLDRRISEVMKAGKSISLLKEWKPEEMVDFLKRKFKSVA